MTCNCPELLPRRKASGDPTWSLIACVVACLFYTVPNPLLWLAKGVDVLDGSDVAKSALLLDLALPFWTRTHHQ